MLKDDVVQIVSKAFLGCDLGVSGLVTFVAVVM